MGRKNKKKRNNRRYQQQKEPDPPFLSWNIKIDTPDETLSSSSDSVLSSEDPSDVVLEIAQSISDRYDTFKLRDLEAKIPEMKTRCSVFGNNRRGKGKDSSVLYTQMQVLMSQRKMQLVRKKGAIFRIISPEEIEKREQERIKQKARRPGYFLVDREAGLIVVGKEQFDLELSDEALTWLDENNAVLV